MVGIVLWYKTQGRSDGATQLHMKQMSIQLRNLAGSMSPAAQNQIVQLPGSQLPLGDSKGLVDSQSGTAISIEDAMSCSKGHLFTSLSDIL